MELTLDRPLIGPRDQLPPDIRSRFTHDPVAEDVVVVALWTTFDVEPGGFSCSLYSLRFWIAPERMLHAPLEHPARQILEASGGNFQNLTGMCKSMKPIRSATPAIVRSGERLVVEIRNASLETVLPIQTVSVSAQTAPASLYALQC